MKRRGQHESVCGVIYFRRITDASKVRKTTVEHGPGFRYMLWWSLKTISVQYHHHRDRDKTNVFVFIGRKGEAYYVGRLEFGLYFIFGPPKLLPSCHV